jgi:acetyl esterase/lipase
MILPDLSRRAALSLLAAVLLPGCTTLGSTSPASGARDIAFGPHPRQKLDIYVPPGGGANRPVVFFIYGGSWSGGAKGTYALVGEAFAARGFVTVIADYRLVPEVRFPVFIEDGALALRFVVDRIARYGGDPRRIHLVGHSAGAYNAMMLALDRRYLAAAGVSPRALRSAVGLSGPYDFLPLEGAVTNATFGNARDLAQTQPITFARRDAPPILLATGSADTTVLPKNTQGLAARLRAAGAPVTVKVYEGLGHADTALALTPLFRWRASLFDDVVGFLER